VLCHDVGAHELASRQCDSASCTKLPLAFSLAFSTAETQNESTRPAALHAPGLVSLSDHVVLRVVRQPTRGVPGVRPMPASAAGAHRTQLQRELRLPIRVPHGRLPVGYCCFPGRTDVDLRARGARHRQHRSRSRVAGRKNSQRGKTRRRGSSAQTPAQARSGCTSKSVSLSQTAGSRVTAGLRSRAWSAPAGGAEGRSTR
jgi:hypothetical protein